MDKQSRSILVEGLFGAGNLLGKVDWRPFRDGVDISPLYQDPDKGSSAALLRYQPGASVPKHDHDAAEYILVLEGSQSDGSREYHAGCMMISGPGTRHAITSENGCIVLAIWGKPVRFVEQE